MIQAVDFSPLGEDVVRQLPYSSKDLSLYQRLIQYFAAVSAAQGEYLDIINFHRDVYPTVVPLSECETLFRPEHGYASPDGSPEVGLLIRAYEKMRAECFARESSVHIKMEFERLGAGLGSGTTGVMNCLLPAIRDVSTRSAPCIALSVPLYSVYDGIAREHGLRPVYLQTRRDMDFLPTAEDVNHILRQRPVALVLTFPGNPAQTTYSPSRIDELTKIVRMCRDAQTYLIADNIYQDTLWSEHAINPEILALAETDRFLVKVSGLSKDRPGCSGWRIGHWIGDATLQERYFYYASIQYNTPNSASRCVLALDLLLRMARLRGGGIDGADLDLIGDDVAGWNRRVDRKRLFTRLTQSDLATRWLARLDHVELRQRKALDLVTRMARGTDVFSDVVNGHIGNVLLVRVSPAFFDGTDHEFFIRLMNTARIGVLPANAFGFAVTPGEAWFRITTIHDQPHRVAEQLDRVARAIRTGLA